MEDIDKKLVSESKLDFKLNGNLMSYKMNDDGIVECYYNDSLVGYQPFSKTTLVRDCKILEQKGYTLVEDADESLDVDKAKQNLEQSIDKVDELQDLKNQLEDKVDKLVNESKEENIEEQKSKEDELTNGISEEESEDAFKTTSDSQLDTSKEGDVQEQEIVTESTAQEVFPSTEFTNKILTVEEINNLDLQKELTIEQIGWITANIGSLECIEEGLKELASFTKYDGELISIDSYIDEIC